MSRRKKFPSTKAFCEQMTQEGIFKPSKIRDEWAAIYQEAEPKSLASIQMCLRRMGLDKETRQEKREELQKEQSIKDIEDYQQVKDYIIVAEAGRVRQKQIQRQLKSIRRIWELMEKTDPSTWSFEEIMNKVKTVIPMIVDDRGRKVFSKPGAVKMLLSPVNTMFKSLPKNWSQGLQREAGELKDSFSIEEFNDFIECIQDTETLSLEGWKALFKMQVNGGFREGSLLKNGILGLLWENIDYETRRCSAHEKGGRGAASRLWRNIPLDLFPWLKAWEDLMSYHRQRFGYLPTNSHHETGRVFETITYDDYRKQFHSIRKRGNGRIAGKGETLKPHILRKTHAQFLVKLWIPLEQICGVFPDGFFGVGWDNPAIPMKYYITFEEKQREKALAEMAERLKVLKLE